MNRKHWKKMVLPVLLIAALQMNSSTAAAEEMQYEPIDSGLWASDTDGSADLQSAWDAYLDDPDHAEAKALIETAESLEGTDFNRLGTMPEAGFTDVSFIIYSLKASGAADMKVCTRESLYGRCKQTSTYSYLPGDLIFFASEGELVHVGICISETKFIHCGTCVRTDTLSEGSWWSTHIAGFGRICNTAAGSGEGSRTDE